MQTVCAVYKSGGLFRFICFQFILNYSLSPFTIKLAEIGCLLTGRNQRELAQRMGNMESSTDLAASLSLKARRRMGHHRMDCVMTQ